MFIQQLWEFCKQYPGWAAAFFFCGYLLGLVFKNSMSLT